MKKQFQLEAIVENESLSKGLMAQVMGGHGDAEGCIIHIETCNCDGGGCHEYAPCYCDCQWFSYCVKNSSICYPNL